VLGDVAGDPRNDADLVRAGCRQRVKARAMHLKAFPSLPFPRKGMTVVQLRAAQLPIRWLVPP
jgi:hypothetical protein